MSDLREATKSQKKAIILADLELEDIGVGSTAAKRLKEAGYGSILELKTASADELATNANTEKYKAATYRIYLRKAGNDRIAGIIDSPYHAYTSEGVRFTINEKGTANTTEESPPEM